MEDITHKQRQKLNEHLVGWGLQLLEDKMSILIEKEKTAIIEMIHYSDELPKVNYSDYINEKLHLDHTYLSNIFLEVKAVTIQQFIINHKIEKVKELLSYDELSLTEISDLVHYSSVSHLSNQFKKTTAVCPSNFQQLNQRRNANLENV